MASFVHVVAGFGVAPLVIGCGGTSTTEQHDQLASYGYVSVVEGSSTATGEYGSASARFYRIGSTSQTQCAVVNSENDCNLIHCNPESATASRSSLDAGQVTIDSEQQMRMKLGSDGSYSTRVDGALWSTGDAITVRVQGNHGDPPAFSTELTVPDSISITQPSDTAVVDRTQDLEFAWTSGQYSYVLVNTSLSAHDPYISCRWVAGDGNGVIPASLLSRLGPGSFSFEVSVEAPPVGALSGHWVFSATAMTYLDSIGLMLE